MTSERRGRQLYHKSKVKRRSSAIGPGGAVVVGIGRGVSPGVGVEGDVSIVVGDAAGVAACGKLGEAWVVPLGGVRMGTAAIGTILAWALLGGGGTSHWSVAL